MRATHEKAARLFDMSLDGLPINGRNAELKMSWGFELANGFVRMMSVTDYDFDLLRGFAARCEKDFDPDLDAQVVRMEKLKDVDGTDSLWRKVMHTTLGTTSDDIVHISLIDGLASPDRSVFLYTYSASGDTELPPLLDGHGRNDNIFCGSKFTPLHAEEGFRELWAGEIKMSATISRIISVIPKWILRRFAKTYFEGGVPSFKDFAAHSEPLGHRIEERGELYSQMVEGLAWTPKTVQAQSKVLEEWQHDQAIECESSCSTADTITETVQTPCQRTPRCMSSRKVKQPSLLVRCGGFLFSCHSFYISF